MTGAPKMIFFEIFSAWHAMALVTPRASVLRRAVQSAATALRGKDDGAVVASNVIPLVLRCNTCCSYGKTA